VKQGADADGRLVIDRDTYLTAIAVMNEHGDEATKHAARRSFTLEKAEDAIGSLYWDEVIVAILELERTWLRPGENLQ
jgi:hypothetical protein